MYPEQLMTDVYWGFYGGKYDSCDVFIREVIEYNKNFDKKWIPEEIVFAGTNVSIQYSYWDDENEEEEEDDFDLVADNKTCFSAGELLYKIHNQVVEKLEDDDHHFFEGLTLWEGENYNNPNSPLYFLNQGS